LIADGYCAACGGHPHQSKIGSEEPIFDSFSLKGEALRKPYCDPIIRPESIMYKASPLGEKLSEKVHKSTFSD